MASKVEQQYKLLNAELMDQVQKQRMEIGAYKKQLIAQKHEIMALREEQIMDNKRQRKDHIAIIRRLMRHLDIDADCLADRTVTEEMEQSSLSFVVNRHSQQRRSSRDICQDMRRSSALACSTKTVSPTRRRDRIVERPKEVQTPPPRRVAELADDGSSEEEEESTTPIETEEELQRQSDEPLLPEDGSSDGEHESSAAIANEEQPTEEGVQRQSDERLFSIIEDSDEEISSYSCSSSSAICCDSTVEEQTPSRRALRSVDPNVVPVSGGVTMTRGKSQLAKSLAKDNSTDEQPSIQVPRLLLTRPSQSPVQSLLSRVSQADATISSPQRGLFEGTFRMSGTNTSTPIPIKAQQTTTKKGEGRASTSRGSQPKVRLRKLVSEPKKSDHERDMSTSCLSSSGRPSRKCRPTQLSEPSLRTKMRNNSLEKKK